MAKGSGIESLSKNVKKFSRGQLGFKLNRNILILLGVILLFTNGISKVNAEENKSKKVAKKTSKPINVKQTIALEGEEELELNFEISIDNDGKVDKKNDKKGHEVEICSSQEDDNENEKCQKTRSHNNLIKLDIEIEYDPKTKEYTSLIAPAGDKEFAKNKAKRKREAIKKRKKIISLSPTINVNTGKVIMNKPKAQPNKGKPVSNKQKTIPQKRQPGQNKQKTIPQKRQPGQNRQKAIPQKRQPLQNKQKTTQQKRQQTQNRQANNRKNNREF